MRRSKGITAEKQPVIIGIGGGHSGSGKTAVAEALLKHFTKEVKGTLLGSPQQARICADESPVTNDTMTLCHSDTNKWGAIKYTKTAIFTSIIDTLEILAQKNKDTARLLNAGASAVLWVQSPAEDLKETLPLAISRMSHLKGIIVEGNSAIEFLKPDIVIFIIGDDIKAIKPGAAKIIEMAHIILFKEKLPVTLPAKAKRFRIDVSLGYGFDKLISYIDRVLYGR